MKKILALIALLATVAVAIFAYGVFEKPGESFFLSRLIISKKEEKKDPTVLLFVGDIMLTRGVDFSLKNNGGGDPRYPFLKIADTLRSADLTIGNLEGPISSRGTNVGSVYSFRHPVESLDGLRFGGFDVLSIANNHIWDYGKIALKDTVDILAGAKILSPGAGENYQQANAPHIANVKDAEIAFFSYTNLYPGSLWAGEKSAGISTPTIENIENSISKIRDQVDLVVVLWHWGEEYQPESNSNQKYLARATIDAGADLVVGTHPHVTQEIEVYKGKFIAYSLGNFVFDQGFSTETMRGHILRTVIRDKKIVTAVPFPVKLTETFQPYLGWRQWQFLESLPFKKLEPSVELAEGFSAYEGVLGDTPGDVHRGIDFVQKKDGKYIPFEVFSMSNGSAMKGESETWGDFVIVRSQTSPTLLYYTIYSHLSAVPEKFKDIKTVPAGSWAGSLVKTGEFLGMADTSGNTKGVPQLHLEIQEEDLSTGQWLKLDPYGIYGDTTTSAYPQPGESLEGLEHYWKTDSPPFAK